MAEYTPEVFIPEAGKIKDSVHNLMRFAYTQNGARDALRKSFELLYNDYNGVYDPDKFKWLTHTHNKKNLGNFLLYRIGKSKIDQLQGEFLRQQIEPTVVAINEEATAVRADEYAFRRTLSEIKPLVDDMRERGVPVFQGIKTETPEEVEAAPLPQTQNEKFMQYLIKNLFDSTPFKAQLGQNFQSLEIVGECWSRTTDKVIVIDPRNIVVQENENDYFGETSPYIGHIEPMYLHDFLVKYGRDIDLSKDEIKALQYNATTMVAKNTGVYRHNNTSTIDVLHLEWKWVTTGYILTQDGVEHPFLKEDYDASKVEIDALVKAGATLTKVYADDLWEGMYIPAIDKVVKYGQCEYQSREMDNPSEVKYNYTGLLFNTINGVRVSLQGMMSPLEMMFGVLMYQINREIGKSKGSVWTLDEGLLAKGMSPADVMYGVANDGVVLFNSAQDGRRMAAVNVDGHIKVLDLSAGRGLMMMIEVKNDILQMFDRISGVNDNRSGNIQASSKVSNVQSSISASQNITEALFYWMNLYTEKVISKYLNRAKMVWPVKHLNKLVSIIGRDGVDFFRVTEGVSMEDYATYVTEGRQGLETRDKLRYWTEVGINSQQITIADAFKADMAKTLVEKQEILERGIEAMNQLQREKMASEEKIAQMNLEGRKQAAQEDREDWQKHAENIEILRARLKMGEAADATEGEVAVTREKAMREMLKTKMQEEMRRKQPEPV